MNVTPPRAQPLCWMYSISFCVVALSLVGVQRFDSRIGLARNLAKAVMYSSIDFVVAFSRMI